MKNKLFLFFKFIATFIIVFLLTNLLYSFIVYLSRLFVWTGDEPLYPLYNFFSEYSLLILLIVFSVEFLVIANYYWSKPLDHLQEVLDTTEQIYQSQDEYIKLPKELTEAEYQLNQLRLNVKENNRIAKEAEQRKNDLLVYLAHDLKTPLTSVIGYLSLLRDEESISKALREKYIGISLEKAERLEMLINEFFEITRFNLSTLTLELSKVNLTRMLQQFVFEFEPMLLPKHLNVKLTIDSDVEVKLDVNKMERVFDNLLKNAINYSFPEKTIEIAVSQLEKTIEIVFSNRGNAIPEEKLDKIFEQFYRLDASRDPSSGGAGLGLAISQEIIELHGGTIEAKSDHDITEFKIVIPLL
ncbi:sensor histidine kinase [Amphibacillus sp. Q70]|uniref:sensor histidine kinase n=1 Tax=Amphibacillus sp. Q70 TaxID=3453416 RepID=UPI003F86CF1D